jgi:hypothetical protein
VEWKGLGATQGPWPKQFKEDGMSERKAAHLIVLGLAACAAACGGNEQRVVDQYFNALRANDTQTLSSFAAVSFDKKVDKWSVTGTEPATRTPATLPDLVKKVKGLEAEFAANKKAAGAYALDHYADIDKVREIEKKNGKIPPSLQGVAEAWKKFNDKDRELKRAIAEAKAAVEKERRNVTLCVGPRDDVESLSGEMVSEKVNVDLTIGGQVQPYVVTLRKYELTGGPGRMVEKWVVQNIEPKG